jgi:hypothetical protein
VHGIVLVEENVLIGHIMYLKVKEIIRYLKLADEFAKEESKDHRRDKGSDKSLPCLFRRKLYQRSASEKET